MFLEQERDRVLTRKILVLQRCIRGWYVYYFRNDFIYSHATFLFIFRYARRRFLRMRAAAIVIQKVIAGYSTVKPRFWNNPQFWNTFAADRNFYYINHLDFGIYS